MASLLHKITTSRRLFSWTVAGLLLCGLFAITARTVHQAERSQRQNLKKGFRDRADIAETFLRSYIEEILKRERSMAELELSEAEISDSDLNAVVHASGFTAAVVLDASGKLVQVYPASPELRGSDIASRYPHLRAALANGTAVSGVVSSAALSAPIVAFATRYDAAGGPRLFSGAYDVRATPLSAYMADLRGSNGTQADLIDASGFIVASSRGLTPRANLLAKIDPLLSKALRAGNSGEYEGERGDKIYVVREVTGTPWRLSLSVEESALYAPLGGERLLLQWSLFVGFCVATLVAAFLLLRLRAMSALHAYLARVDRLTGLPNRMHLEEQLARAVSASTRQDQPLSIFIVDVDHFKRVNDSYGHRAGDEVLRVLSRRMAAALRTEDMLGRWGGEEFLALLPNTSAEGALAVANRVRTMASSAPVVTASGDVLHVTVSIGCATRADARDVDYIQRADEALYSAKRLGRDRVVSSAPPRAGSKYETTNDQRSRATS